MPKGLLGTIVDFIIEPSAVTAALTLLSALAMLAFPRASGPSLPRLAAAGLGCGLLSFIAIVLVQGLAVHGGYDWLPLFAWPATGLMWLAGGRLMGRSWAHNALVAASVTLLSYGIDRFITQGILFE